MLFTGDDVLLVALSPSFLWSLLLHESLPVSLNNGEPVFLQEDLRPDVAVTVLTMEGDIDETVGLQQVKVVAGFATLDER